MAITTVPNIIVDLTGLHNPEPSLRLDEAATKWRAGDTVRVVANDEYFANDFLRWCVAASLTSSP
jgi:TusA-related sulfurtransferase